MSLVITNARLAHADRAEAQKLWKVECKDGRVSSIEHLSACRDVPAEEIDAKGSLMIPSLCHAHIHLDKCFLLEKAELKTGDFAEAMSLTGGIKSKFKNNPEDIYHRGYRLVRESVACGVTSTRAHVEVDASVELICLEAALRLKHTFRDVCDIQIAVFAQEALFSDSTEEQPNDNYRALERACRIPGVSAVGSAPYVESTITKSKANIALVLDLARRSALHVDFHLDYNLDPESEPLIYEVISQARQDTRFHESASFRARVTLGHCTRLQLFSDEEWHELVQKMEGLPISLVSLPQSDIYMMGRSSQSKLGSPRGTLNVPQLFPKYSIQVAMSVNNIENAFTPQGSVDPLSLCSFGAAIFQSASTEDTRTLLRAVTVTSKAAIGMTDQPTDLVPSCGDPADFVVLNGITSVQSAVLNPGFDRITIRRGVVVSRRSSVHWTKLDGEDEQVA
ncbi:hypothetical protein BDV98DRAFT_529775 [Pterulicium gracile]|uniref:Amidohydrolase-related domain-containing protein n=1 Tax=Pterulicium gracile TaxID=1884261 RepID=A0A5C3QKY8_9AGAR|nr:hypothetical protein BDV98DRAFT_529775 [Pterula gracilis]